jgi:DNA (cytosine-5)-methyltransferase 1
LCDINDRLRPLTTIEQSYIQTFSKTFKFKGNKSDLEQMIGNAVPIKLAEYVARCLQEYLNDRARNIPNDLHRIQLNLVESSCSHTI